MPTKLEIQRRCITLANPIIADTEYLNNQFRNTDDIFYPSTLSAGNDITDFDSYIINLSNGHWKPLPIVPESISESLSAQWNDTTIMGRSSSYKSYQGTSNRTINFELDLHIDMLNQYSSSSYNGKDEIDLTNIVNFLKSLVYPEYTPSELRPPVCILKIMDLIKIRGICTLVAPTHKLPLKAQIDSRNGSLQYLNYKMVHVSLNFTEVPIKAPSATEIEDGKQFYYKD